MRISAKFQLKNREIQTDYRRAILALLKTGLSNYSSGEFYHEWYDGSAKEKSFCFSVMLPKGSAFNKETICLGDTWLHITFSTSDHRTAMLLLNILQEMKGTPFPLVHNEMTLISIAMLPEMILPTTSKIYLRMLAPLCVRTFQEENRQYVSIQHDDFVKQVCDQLKRRYRNLPDNAFDGFCFMPIDMKKTVITHYDQKIECTLGSAFISSDPRLLKAIYDNGLGTRCSAGFGLIDIIRQE